MSKQGIAIQKIAAVMVTPENSYTKMPTAKLDTFIKSVVMKTDRLSNTMTRQTRELYQALNEMGNRYQKQERYRTDLKALKAPTWHQYLESRGVKPATLRQWKHREALKQIQSLVQLKAVALVPDVNVTADELTRALASLANRLTGVVKEQTRLNPAVRTNLLRALNNLTPIAERLSIVVEAPASTMCHQRVVRERLASLADEPDLEEKKRLAADFTHASYREISYEEAKNLILANEYLGSMGSATHYVGLFCGEYLAGVECFGLVGGTHVAASICGPEYKDQVRVLVRGCCTFWSPPNSASWLLSRACDLMAEMGFPIICAFSDPAGSEIGVCYQSANFKYTGMTQASEQYRTPDGKVHDSRQISGLTRDRRNGQLAYKRTRKEQRKILEQQGCEFYQGNAKHRYVLISGRWKKQLTKALRLPSLPYPKREVTETPLLNGMKHISFSYPGGKARLATKLCAQFPQSGSRFVDVFAGRGNLLWRAMQLLNYDQWWINDIRTAKFFEALRVGTVTVPERSREEYEKQKANRGTSESILLEPYLTFSGGGYTWSGSRGDKTRVRAGYGQEAAGISQAGYQRMLERAHEMLGGTGYCGDDKSDRWAVPRVGRQATLRAGYQATLGRGQKLINSKDVLITDWDYRQVLAELGPDDFVYLDPPYRDADVRAYGSAVVDHAELIEILLKAKFKWALSEYKNPIYLEAFGEPAWSQVRTITYGRGTDRPKQVATECLWTADEYAAFSIEEAA